MNKIGFVNQNIGADHQILVGTSTTHERGTFFMVEQTSDRYGIGSYPFVVLIWKVKIFLDIINSKTYLFLKTITMHKTLHREDECPFSGGGAGGLKEV